MTTAPIYEIHMFEVGVWTYHKSFLRLNNVPASVPLIDVATQQQQKEFQSRTRFCLKTQPAPEQRHIFLNDWTLKICNEAILRIIL